MAGADCDAVAVEDARHIVRVDVLDVEGDDARLVVARRIAAVELDVRLLAQLRQRVVDEVLLDGLDAVERDRLEVVDGRRQAGSAADVLRAGLELSRQFRIRRVLLDRKSVV